MSERRLVVMQGKLPEPLGKKEVLELFKRMYQGDNYAKELLAYHNLRLVLDIVNKKYYLSPYDKQELICIGNMGLVNAINTFDILKDVSFSTYATTCISNEISKFIYLQKRKKKEFSLGKVIKVSFTGAEITLEDTLLGDVDLEYDYLEEELKEKLREEIRSLSAREQYIIKRYFENELTLEEISKELEITRSAISQILNRAINKIGNRLEASGIIEERPKVNARKRKKNRVKMEEKI